MSKLVSKLPNQSPQVPAEWSFILPLSPRPPVDGSWASWSHHRANPRVKRTWGPESLTGDEPAQERHSVRYSCIGHNEWRHWKALVVLTYCPVSWRWNLTWGIPKKQADTTDLIHAKCIVVTKTFCSEKGLVKISLFCYTKGLWCIQSPSHLSVGTEGTIISGVTCVGRQSNIHLCR